MTLRTTTLASAVLVALAGPAAHATLVTTGTFTTPTPQAGTTTTVGVQGVTAPYSAAPISGTGYSISFTGTGAGNGVVKGTASNQYSNPVAGISGGNPTYLTGDFGSAQTTNLAAAGNYLSTGTGFISISFTANEMALSLLWGSPDTPNTLTFLENGVIVGTVTGTQAQTALAGVSPSGADRSGYITVNSTMAFNQVVASSSAQSFEFDGVLASTQAITNGQAVPEPASIALLGTGLLGLGMLRRRSAPRA